MATISFKLLLDGGVGSGLTSAFGGVAKKISGLQNKLSSLNKTTAKIGQFRKLNDQLKQLKTKMDEGGTGSANARIKWEKTKTTLSELSEELKKAGINMDDLSGAEKRLASATDKMNGKLTKQKTYAAKQKALSGNISKYQSMKQSAFAGGLTGIVAPVMALTAPVKAAVVYEEKMAEVKKVTKLSADDFSKLGTGLIDMSTRIPMSIEGLGDITAAAGQANVAQTREELLAFAETAAKMGVAFDVSGGQAGKIMADWRAGMGLSQAQAVDLADAVNHLSNNLNATAPDLAEVIQRQGAVAKTAGLADHEVAALGAAFLSAGAPPEVAATGLKNFTNALVKGSATSKAARGYWDKIGLIPEDVAKNMQVDAEATITQVLTAMKTKLEKHELSAAVGKMFGEVSKGAIMPLFEHMKNLEEAFGLVGDKAQYAGSMLEEYVIRSRTTANNLKLAGNQLAAIGTVLGSVLLPPLNEVLGVFSQFSKKIMEISKAYPNLTGAVVGGTAGILAAGAAFNLLGGAAKFSIGGLGSAFNMLKKLATLQVGPLFLIAGAVVGLIAVLKELGAIEPLKKGFMEGLREWGPDIKAALEPGKEAIQDVLKSFQDFLKAMGADVDLSTWEGIGRTLGSLAGMLGEGFAMELSATAEALQWFGESIGNVGAAFATGDWTEAAKTSDSALAAFRETWTGFKLTVEGDQGGIFSEMEKGFSSIGKWIGDITFALGKTGWDGALKAAFAPFKDTARGAFESLKDIVSGNITAIGDEFKGIKENITLHVVGGIALAKEKFDAFLVTIAELGPKIIDAFKNAIDTMKAFLSSISLFEEGKKLIQSLADGIKAKGQEAINAVKDIGSQIKEAVVDSTPGRLFGDAKKFWMEQFGFKAAGGLVRAGQPYIVGERGPELIFPSAGAKVIPNHHVMEYFMPGRMVAGSIQSNRPVTAMAGWPNFNIPSMGEAGLPAHHVVERLPGRAAGGLIQGNRPYMVGERGPELIIPNAGGKVIPTHHVMEYLVPNVNRQGRDQKQINISGKILESLPGRANGGPIQGGKPYLVGERGPELIIPNINKGMEKKRKSFDLFQGLADLLSGRRWGGAMTGGSMPGGSVSGAGAIPSGGSGGISIFNMIAGGGLGNLLGSLVRGISGPMAGGIFDLIGGDGNRPDISIPMPGGQTVNVTVNIPAGVSNPDQVRQAAADGVMSSIDGIKKAINDIYHDERRLSFA